MLLFNPFHSLHLAPTLGADVDGSYIYGNYEYGLSRHLEFRV